MSKLELECVGCHRPATVFVAKRLNSMTNLTVDNSGTFLCVYCYFMRPGWLFIEATR